MEIKAGDMVEIIKGKCAGEHYYVMQTGAGEPNANGFFSHYVFLNKPGNRRYLTSSVRIFRPARAS